MRSTPLFLSNWDDPAPISIPAKIVQQLSNYQIMGIRFLYECFRKQLNGAILNHESEMNMTIQIAAFLNAVKSCITTETPALVICSEESVKVWYYHLVNHGEYDITILSEDNCHIVTRTVILAVIENAQLLREIRDINFAFVAVDQLDKVVTKIIIRQLKGQFNIGLTSRNFLKYPDQKLFWNMLNWSNPGVLGKFADFFIEDNENLRNLRCPYAVWWQRLSWLFPGFTMPPEKDRKEYKTAVKNFFGHHQRVPDIKKEKPSRKRKLPSKVDKTAGKKAPKKNGKIQKKQIVTEESETDDGSEMDTLLKTSVKSEIKIKNSNNSSAETIMDEAETVANDSDSSQGTIIYSPPRQEGDEVLYSLFDNCSSSKITTLSNNEINPNIKEEQSSSGDVLSMLFEPSQNTKNVENDILTSIIHNSARSQNDSYTIKSVNKNEKNDMLSFFFD